MKSDSDLAREIREIYVEGTPPSIRQLMQRLGYVSEGGATRYRIKDIIEEQGLPMPVGRPGYAKSLPKPGGRRYLHIYEGAKP